MFKHPRLCPGVVSVPNSPSLPVGLQCYCAEACHCIRRGTCHHTQTHTRVTPPALVCVGRCAARLLTHWRTHKKKMPCTRVSPLTCQPVPVVPDDLIQIMLCIVKCKAEAGLRTVDMHLHSLHHQHYCYCYGTSTALSPSHGYWSGLDTT